MVFNPLHKKLGYCSTTTYKFLICKSLLQIYVHIIIRPNKYHYNNSNIYDHVYLFLYIEHVLVVTLFLFASQYNKKKVHIIMKNRVVHEHVLGFRIHNNNIRSHK